MNEHQRMQYLEAMGVDVFVPRFVLPHSKSSSALTFASAEPEFTVPTQASQAIPNTHDGHREPPSLSGEVLRSLNDGLNSVLENLEPSSKKAFVSKVPAQTTTAEAKADLPPSELSSKGADASPSNALAAVANHGVSGGSIDLSAEPALSGSELSEKGILDSEASFHLSLWRTDSQLQILDTREPQDALPTDALLTNILIANGLLSTRLSAPEVQRWPISDAKGLDNSWRAASAMMHDFLSVRFQRHPVKYFLLFGQHAANVVLGADFDFDAKIFSSVRAEQYGLDAIVLPSLRTFLYSPIEKRHLWQALKPLREQD